MKTRIDKLLAEIGKFMQGHLATHDFKEVTKLAALLSRVQQLQKRNAELEGEVAEIEATLKAAGQKGVAQDYRSILPELEDKEEETHQAGRAKPQTLRIEVDWKANGKQHDQEVILLPKAADSMVEFLGRVVEEMGQEALQKLCRIRINRGLLLSHTPAKDFLNPAQGKPYGHKRLRGTSYYVLTHSQTSQKAEDLNRICRVLGLVPGSVQIRVVDRAESYAELYV